MKVIGMQGMQGMHSVAGLAGLAGLVLVGMVGLAGIQECLTFQIFQTRERFKSDQSWNLGRWVSSPRIGCLAAFQINMDSLVLELG